MFIAADAPTRIVGATDNRYRAKSRQDRQAHRFGTILTMVLVPVLYATLYRVPSPESSKAS
jgi:hypothetical protein